MGTKTVSEHLRSLERDADNQRRALEAIEGTARTSVCLAAPDDVIRIVFDLEACLTPDVARGRQELRYLFRDGHVDLVPQPAEFRAARSQIVPVVFLTGPPAEADLGGRNKGSRYSASILAGRI